MRPNPQFEIDDPGFIRELIRGNPWATIVSAGAGGLVASHYPVLIDEQAPELTVLTHVGRPDEKLHDLGESEVMIVVQGRHGYISHSWYSAEERKVPTWNFTVAHCHGVPEILGEEENLRVLTELVAHFERELPAPTYLDPEEGALIAKGTVGIRIPIARFVCKQKLSQNKDDRSRRQVIAALREAGPYRDPELAAEMERSLEAEG
jgi:transcriptional regulator